MPVTLLDGQLVGPHPRAPAPPCCVSGTGPATRTPGSPPRSGTTAKGYKRAPEHPTQAITLGDEENQG
jgi:hypothetical protein